MRRPYTASWLPLVLLPLTANARSCEESIVLADASPKDWHLTLDEFETFCNLEAQETPVLLERDIFKQPELPPALLAVYDFLADGDKGIDIEGIQLQEKDKQLIVAALCFKTREAMASMLVEAEGVSPVYGVGPFAGETASGGLHHGNRVAPRQSQGTDVPPENIQPPPPLGGSVIDMGEGEGPSESMGVEGGPPEEGGSQQPGEGGLPGMPPIGNGTIKEYDAYACADYNATLDICVAENMCESCDDILDELAEPGAPDILSLGSVEEIQYNQIVTYMNDYLKELCGYQVAALCQLKQCCSACTMELDAVFQCSTQEGEQAIRQVLEEMSALLAETSDSSTLTTDPPMELVFQCALDACGDTGGGGSGEGVPVDMEKPVEEPVSAEVGGLSLDQCPDQMVAYRSCLEAETCTPCLSQVGPAPESPPYFGDAEGDLPPYNTIIETVNEHLMNQCTFFQYTRCSLRDCCEACSVELDAWFECLNEIPLETQQAGIDETYLLLSFGEPIPDDAKSLVYECDIVNVDCDAVGPPPPPPMTEGEVGEAGSTIEINAGVLIANTLGYDALTIKAEFTKLITAGFDATLSDEEFLASVVEALSAGPAIEGETASSEATAVGVPGDGMPSQGGEPTMAGIPGDGPSETADGEAGNGMPPQDGATAMEEGSPPAAGAGIGSTGTAMPPDGGRRNFVRTLQDLSTPLELYGAQITDIVDVDCPLETTSDPDLTLTCQIVYGRYTAQTDGTLNLQQLERAMRAATDMWITGGGLQRSMPADSPIMVLGLAPPLVEEIQAGGIPATSEPSDGESSAENPPEGQPLNAEVGVQNGQGPGGNQSPANNTYADDVGGMMDSNSTEIATDGKLEPPTMGQKPILVNSSFLVSTADSKTAAELKQDLESPEVQALAMAYMNFVSGVAEGLGAEAGMVGLMPGGQADGERQPPEGSSPPPGAAEGSGSPPEASSEASGSPPEGQEEGSGLPPEGSGQPGDEGPTEADQSGTTRERSLRVEPSNWNRLSRVRTRRLAVTYDAASAEIYDFQDTACGDDVAAVSKQAVQADSATSNCIAVFGKYRIIAGEEDNEVDIYNMFVEATQASIANGKLDEEVRATAAKENVTTTFVVHGVSPIVDESFTPFEEMLAQTDDEDEGTTVDNSDEANTTYAPIVPAAVSNSTNAPRPKPTEPPTESSARGSLTGILVSVLAATITTFTYL